SSDLTWNDRSGTTAARGIFRSGGDRFSMSSRRADSLAREGGALRRNFFQLCRFELRFGSHRRRSGPGPFGETGRQSDPVFIRPAVPLGNLFLSGALPVQKSFPPVPPERGGGDLVTRFESCRTLPDSTMVATSVLAILSSTELERCRRRSAAFLSREPS